MAMTGGEAIVKMLKNEGIEVVFAIPDGTYGGLINNLKKHGIKMITPRHESCGVHAAGVYAKLTGKIGVALASNGPGCAAALSGIAVEQAEGHRVMVITSSRRTEIIYPDRGGSYQVIDQTGIIGPMSKYSESANLVQRVPEIMKQAFRKCWEGRPGVVHVDCPETVMNGKHNFSETDFLPPHTYRRVEPLHPSETQVKQAARMLVDAKFPVLHVGNGIQHCKAYEELELIANLLQAPTTSSWAARGSLCENNPLSVPLTAIEFNDDLRREADLILCIGSRVGETDWWGKSTNWGSFDSQKWIQVDIEESAIGRTRPVDLGIVSDGKVFLRKLYEEVKSMKDQINTQERTDKFNSMLIKAEKSRAKIDKLLDDIESPVHTAHIGNLCKKNFASDSIAIFDGGNTAIWGQFFYKCTTPGNGISTPKMGMLGAGVPQALGAAAARPDKQVYCIIGDGAFGYHPQEVETAVRNNMNITFIIAADRQWGMVKINQQFSSKPIKTILKKEFDEDELVNADFGEIKWDKMAEAMGATGYRVDNANDLDAALAKCAASPGCKVVHVDVDRTKHLWAPALQTFKKMHAEPKTDY
jgi:acetolactate synthase-1/2/3 large subunit